MTLTTTTHLNLRGDARAALAFYADVFDGEVALTTYGDVGMPRDLPGADGIVFGQVTAGHLRLMAYDVPGATGGSAAQAGETRRENGTTITTQPFFVVLGGASLDEVQGPWDRLLDGGTVVEPLAASAWSPGFGMVTDRFGVTWVVQVAASAG